MSLAKRVAFSTIYQTAGKILSVVLGLVQVFLLTQYLGAHGYGQYATVTAFFGIAISLAEFGLHITNVTNITKPGANQSKILSNAFTLRVLSTVGVFIVAVLLGFFVFPYDHTIKLGILFTSYAFALLSINQVFVGVFQKNFANHILVLGEAASKVVTIAAILILSHFHIGVVGILASLNLAMIVYLGTTMIWAYKYIPFSLDFDLTTWKQLLKQSWPIAFSVVLNLVYFRADTLILSVYKGATDVGIYSLPYKVLEVLIAFPGLFAGLLLPIFAESFHNNDLARFKKILQQGFNTLAYVALLVILEVMIFANDIIRFVARGRYDEFAASPSVFRWLIIAIGFLFVGNLFGHAVPALNLQKKMIWGYLSSAIVGLALYFILIPKFSYYGGAWGTVATEFIAAAFSASLVLYKIRYRLQISGLLKAGLAFAVILITVNKFPQVLHPLYWLINALIVVVVYTLLLMAFGAISKEDIRLLLPQRKIAE